MGGMEGADSRAVEARLDRRPAAARPAGLGRDPQVAGVAALELGDDLRPGGEPAVEDLHGRAAERARFVPELDARFAVEVQRGDFEPGELGDVTSFVARIEWPPSRPDSAIASDVPTFALDGQAAGPLTWISASEAWHCGRAVTSMPEPGGVRTTNFATAGGLAFGSSGLR